MNWSFHYEITKFSWFMPRTLMTLHWQDNLMWSLSLGTWCCRTLTSFVYITLCNQAYGASKYKMLGIYMQRSTVLLTTIGIPLTIIYAFRYPILLLLGQSVDITSVVSMSVYSLICQIFTYFVNFPIQKFLQAQSIIAPSAYIYIYGCTLVLHFLLSWLAVYKLGFVLVRAFVGVAFVLVDHCWSSVCLHCG